MPHPANGGIGVSYSNVALGGSHPLVETGQTSYSQHYGNKPITSVSHYTHIPRFLNNKQAVIASGATNNEYAYIKGVDFNS